MHDGSSDHLADHRTISDHRSCLQDVPITFHGIRNFGMSIPPRGTEIFVTRPLTSFGMAPKMIQSKLKMRDNDDSFQILCRHQKEQCDHQQQELRVQVEVVECC